MLMVFNTSGKYLRKVLFWSRSTKSITNPDGTVICYGCPSLRLALLARPNHNIKEIP
jgi:hypothetical protein